MSHVDVLSIFDAILKSLAITCEQNSATLVLLMKLLETRLPPVNQPPPPRPLSFADMVRVVHSDTDVINDKTTRLVIVGRNEEASDEETARADHDLIKDLVAKCGNKDILDEWNAGRITSHRHGIKNTPPRRIIKIQVASRLLRDAFLSGIWSNRRGPLSGCQFAYARRDLTMDELQTERKLKAECRRRNEKAGQVEAVVRDCRIVTLRYPRPFDAHQHAAPPTVADHLPSTLTAALPAAAASSPSLSPPPTARFSRGRPGGRGRGKGRGGRKAAPRSSSNPLSVRKSAVKRSQFHVLLSPIAEEIPKKSREGEPSEPIEETAGAADVSMD